MLLDPENHYSKPITFNNESVIFKFLIIIPNKISSMKRINLFLISLIVNIFSSSAQNGKADSAVVHDLSVSQADSLIQAEAADTDFKIIDVRTPSEFSGGHLFNAINMDYYSPNFSTNIAAFDTSGIYLVYCGTGGRSALASAIMVGLNFQHVYNMLGGITQWINAGLPIDTTSAIPEYIQSSYRISIYPNPSKDFINLCYQNAFYDAFYEIYSNDGKLLKTARLSNQQCQEIPLINFTDGIYFLRIKEGKSSQVKKVVIQKQASN